MAKRLKHGAIVGGKRTREYRSWSSMIARCYNEHAPNYYLYGARGVRVCDRWRHDFSVFLADMGPRPDGCSLDRINSDGDYTPANCRWATPKMQIKNRRKDWHKVTPEMVRRIRAIGRSRTLRSIAAEFGISHTNVRHIIIGRIHA